MPKFLFDEIFILTGFTSSNRTELLISSRSEFDRDDFLHEQQHEQHHDDLAGDDYDVHHERDHDDDDDPGDGN